MKDKLKDTLIKRLNREFSIAESNGSLDSRSRTISEKINPIKGLLLNTDNLAFHVDADSDFRIEVETILVSWNKLTVVFRFDHYLFE